MQLEMAKGPSERLKFQSSSLTEKGCSGGTYYFSDTELRVSILIPY